MTENEQMFLIKKYFRTTEIPKGLVLPSDPVLIAGILGDYEAASDLLKEAYSTFDKWYMARMLKRAGLQEDGASDIYSQLDQKILEDQIVKAKELVQDEKNVLKLIGLCRAMR